MSPRVPVVGHNEHGRSFPTSFPELEQTRIHTPVREQQYHTRSLCLHPVFPRTCFVRRPLDLPAALQGPLVLEVYINGWFPRPGSRLITYFGDRGLNLCFSPSASNFSSMI